MKEKIKEIINKIINFAKTKFLVIDNKINTVIPNPKLKVAVYITIGSMFAMIMLIIILGILISPMRRSSPTNDTVLNKPNIKYSENETPAPLSEIQKEILNLENKTNDLKFPESILNIPEIEVNLSAN